MNLFETRIHRILDDFGVSPSLHRALKLPLQAEAVDLVSCGPDVFGREQRMTPETAEHWRQMCETAALEGVILQLVSAFRSVDYQCELIRNKLDRGQLIEDIVRVNALPGYSEHHTGCALDITTPGAEPLEESFEQTGAFLWLCQHAGRFGFALSYPRDNPWGMAYEPWHWARIP
ncbi:MAG: D-alanyl-D-alanine carboxypeptidase family protein [Pseudomonadota bacterium]